MEQIIKHFKKINNKGSALVTTVIIAGFMAIIVTIVLFVTVRTYKTRMIDYHAKQNFYETEKALDELKAYLIIDCSECCQKAYVDTLNQYMGNSGGQRKAFYNKQFIEYTKEIWLARTNGQDMTKTLQNISGSNFSQYIESAGEITYNEDEAYYCLKDVVVSCSTIEGYYSRIKTDIRVSSPCLDWADGTGNAQINNIDIEECVIYANWQRD